MAPRTKEAKAKVTAALAVARAKRQELKAQGVDVTIVQKDPIEKLATKPTSLRLAINAKCYDCVGQGADGHWRGPNGSIGQCVVTKCPLYAVRPYQKNSGSDDDEGDE